MKDQVDNLADKGITDAVTINGLLDPITKALAIQRVQDGEAALLYIAPEMLRSKTIERILMARHVVRFVIDEAHCFSAWGKTSVWITFISEILSKSFRKTSSFLPLFLYPALPQRRNKKSSAISKIILSVNLGLT